MSTKTPALSHEAIAALTSALDPYGGEFQKLRAIRSRRGRIPGGIGLSKSWYRKHFGNPPSRAVAARKAEYPKAPKLSRKAKAVFKANQAKFAR